MKTNKSSTFTIGIDLGIERSELYRSERDVPHRGATGGENQTASTPCACWMPRARSSCRNQLRISKAGNCYLRKLLVGSVQYILGRFGLDSALSIKGLKLAEKGGPRAKRKAVMAVARNLAVLLLILWHDEALYEADRRAA
jgi:hypothetical protein